MTANASTARLLGREQRTARQWSVLLGCTPAAVHKRIAKGLPIDAPVRRGKLTPEVRAQIVACRGSAKAPQVARQYGVSEAAVYDVWRAARPVAVVAPPAEPEPDLHARIEAALVELEAAAERCAAVARYTQAVAVEQAWWARRAAT